MKYAKWAVYAVLVLLAYSYAFSTASKLLSAPSDWSVTAGIIILLAMLGFAVWGTGKIWEKVKAADPDILKRILPVLAIGLLLPFLLSLGGCGTRIEPGHAGIEVDLYGKDRGVQDTTIKTGMVWYNPFTTTVFNYPTFVQTAVWARTEKSNEEITYNSSEGMTFTADISIAYRLSAEKVPAFYVKFRSDDLAKFTHGFFRNTVRDAFNEVAQTHTTDELYGAKKETMLQEVRARVNAAVADLGVVIEQLGYIGSPRPPESIIGAINRKIQAIQDAQAAENKVAQIKAQAEQAVAQADGQAKANALLDKSLTANLIEWRRLHLIEEAIAKWDGKRPMVEGNASGLLLSVSPSTPAIDTTPPEAKKK